MEPEGEAATSRGRRWRRAGMLLAACTSTALAAAAGYRLRRRRGGAAVAQTRTVALDAAHPPVVRIAVNPGAGAAHDVAGQLRRALGDAAVVEVEDPAHLEGALRSMASEPDVDVVAVAGGDGSAGAAAAAAVANGRALGVVPAGTLNHLARDLGITTVEAGVDALRSGRATTVDVATIDGRQFLNTASFGSYAELVDIRERYEDRIGKWPAFVVALIRVVRRVEPIEVVLDGRKRSLWMVFIGNGTYLPAGFAPTRRPRLDDGVLDVRIIDASHPWCRTRLVLGLLTGRLGRSRVYDQWRASRVVVHAEGTIRLAADGETFDGGPVVVIEKRGDRVLVCVP